MVKYETILEYELFYPFAPKLGAQVGAITWALAILNFYTEICRADPLDRSVLTVIPWKIQKLDPWIWITYDHNLYAHKITIRKFGSV